MAKPARPRQRIVSPKGVAVFPRLSKPDTKFDADGVFKTGLRLDKSDPAVADFLHQLEAFASANGVGNGKLPWKDEVSEAGDVTGNVIVNYKVKAKWPNGESRKPAIVDGQKREFEGAVGGGSVIRISGEMSTYEGFGGGVTLQPLAVQVIEVKTWSKGVDDFDIEGEDDAPAASEFDSEPEF